MMLVVFPALVPNHSRRLLTLSVLVPTLSVCFSKKPERIFRDYFYAC